MTASCKVPSSTVPSAAGGNISVLLDRPRLRAKLDAHRDDVVLIRAPAGFGKSVLMQQWATYSTGLGAVAVVVEVEIGPGADQRTILRHIQSQCTVDGDGPRACMDEDDELKAFLLMLARRGVRTLILELEHRGELPDAAQRVLSTLVRWKRRPLGLFITSRHDLSLVGGVPRLEGRVATLSRLELAFDIDEMRAACQEYVSSAVYEELWSLTKGWPIALVHGCRLFREDGAAPPMRELTTGAIAAYCYDEVLCTLAPPALDALIKTSFLEEFDIDLLVAVTERKDSWRTVEELIRFGVVESAPGNTIYRCHPLLRRICLHRLELRGQGEIEDCRRKAATRLVQAKAFMAALQVALPVADASFITDLFLHAGGIAIGLRDGAEQLNAALDLMPEECFRHPRVGVAHALALAKRGNFVAAADLLATIRLNAVGIRDEELAHDLLIAELFVEGSRGTFPTEQAVREIARHADFLRTAFAYNVRCMMALEMHNVSEATANMESSVAYFERVGSANGVAHMTIHRGRIRRLIGELPMARSDFLLAEQQFVDRPHPDRGGQAIARIFLAETLLQMGDFTVARAICVPALEQLERGEYYWEALHTGYTTLHALELAGGDGEAARSALARGIEYGRTRSLELLSSLMIYHRALSSLPAGSVGGNAEGALEPLPPPRDRRADIRFAYERARAWHMFRTGHRTRSRAMLAVLKRRSLNNGAHAVAIEPMLDLVLMDEASGNRTSALEELRSALVLASRCQLYWPFLVRADALTPLIMIAQTSADPDWCGAGGATHARNLLQRLTADKRAATSLFTAREQVVLLMLADRKNNKEIARELDLSPETVRFHLKNIYTKFGVELGYKNRQVVAMLAREHGFVPIDGGASSPH